MTGVCVVLRMIVALSGGTGGAKLIEGLASELDPAELTIICNTGDDTIFHGLYVCPDLDTIVYTLAGCNDAAKGWGIENDSFAALEQLFALRPTVARHRWRIRHHQHAVEPMLGIPARRGPLADRARDRRRARSRRHASRAPERG